MISKKIVVLFDIDYTLFDTDSFKESGLRRYMIYDEILDVFKELSGKVDLGIFSKGETGFQNNKLVETGLNKYFKKNDIHIFEDKNANLKGVINRYENYKIFLIDDKLSVLYEASLISPSIFTVWVKRGPFIKNQEPIENFSPDAMVENISNLTKIIENN